MTAVRVIKTKGRFDPVTELQPFEVEATKVSDAKRQAREKLQEKWSVRSINAIADGSGLIAYVCSKSEEAKVTRGKPVEQTGPVGKGRSLVDKARRTRKGWR